MAAAFFAGAAFSALIVGGALVGIRAETRMGFGDYLRGVGALGAVATAAIGLVALVFARDQLADARKNAAVDRAADFNRRLNTPEILGELRFAVDFCFAPTHRARELRYRTWLADDEARRRVVALWNLFEELGVKYNQGLVDRGTVDRFYRHVSLLLHHRSAWLIDRWQRDGAGWRGYPEWERMNRALSAV